MASREYPKIGNDGTGKRKWAIWLSYRVIATDSKGRYRRFATAKAAARAMRKLG